MFVYWDKISLLTNNDTGQVSFLTSILKAEKQFFASQDDGNQASENTYTLKFWENRMYSDLVLFSMLFSEILIKGAGALLVDAYVYTRDKRKKAEGISWLLWGALSLVTGAVNALIAQPLIFVANTLLHVRAFCDAVLNLTVAFFDTVASLLFGDTRLDFAKQRAVAGGKSLIKSSLCLLADAVIGGFVYGLGLLCSLIPGGQVLTPVLTAHATAAQAAAGAVTMGIIDAVTVASSTLVTVAVSSAVQQKFLNKASSSKNILNELYVENSSTGLEESSDDVVSSSPLAASSGFGSPPKEDSPPVTRLAGHEARANEREPAPIVNPRSDSIVDSPFSRSPQARGYALLADGATNKKSPVLLPRDSLSDPQSDTYIQSPFSQ